MSEKKTCPVLSAGAGGGLPMPCLREGCQIWWLCGGGAFNRLLAQILAVADTFRGTK